MVSKSLKIIYIGSKKGELQKKLQTKASKQIKDKVTLLVNYFSTLQKLSFTAKQLKRIKAINQ